jgi:exosortase
MAVEMLDYSSTAMAFAALSENDTVPARAFALLRAERARVSFIVALISILYGWTLLDMTQAWWTNPNFSQGMLIPPLALYLAWQDRDRTRRLQVQPDLRGLFLVFGSCLLFLIGRMAAEYFLPRISFVLLVVGLTWTFWGKARLRSLAFPFLLLATMVPLPALLYNAAATPLQLLASDLATRLAEVCGTTVYQDGNIIHLANLSLGVEEACSGLSSLSALMVASLLLGQVYSCGGATRAIIFALSIPIAIAANIFRIAFTAVLADHYEELAMGFYHAFSGWLVFLAGYLMLYISTRIVYRSLDGYSRSRA